MPAITIPLSEETYHALESRAIRYGRSTEAEIQEILDAAVRPAECVKLGSTLAAIGCEFGGVDLAVQRDKTVKDPIAFDDPR